MAVEFGTGPPPELRHEEPVLCLSVAVAGAEGPGIKTVEELKCVFSSDAEFYTEVWGGSGIV